MAQGILQPLNKHPGCGLVDGRADRARRHAHHRRRRIRRRLAAAQPARYRRDAVRRHQRRAVTRHARRTGTPNAKVRPGAEYLDTHLEGRGSTRMVGGRCGVGGGRHRLGVRPTIQRDTRARPWLWWRHAVGVVQPHWRAVVERGFESSSRDSNPRTVAGQRLSRPLERFMKINMLR